MMNWSVYIIRASDGYLYTGVTTCVQRRFREHCEGAAGAKFFRGREPIKVELVENGHTRSSACRREMEIKRMSREQKEQMIATWRASTRGSGEVGGR